MKFLMAVGAVAATRITEVGSPDAIRDVKLAASGPKHLVRVADDDIDACKADPAAEWVCTVAVLETDENGCIAMTTVLDSVANLSAADQALVNDDFVAMDTDENDLVCELEYTTWRATNDFALA